MSTQTNDGSGHGLAHRVKRGARMSLRRIVFTALTVSLLAACAADDAVETPPPVADGAQGPGTAIPDDRADDRDGRPAPAAPAAPAPSGSQETPAAPPEAEKPAAPVKVVLDVKWYGQETYYWCGPGSTRIALSARLPNPPSQTALAQLMGTTTNGTDHIGLVANALNKHFGGGGYKSRPMNDPPTPAQRDLLKKDLLARIGDGYPIVANVISGWRPPGYPGGTIYHYVAVVGFDEGGDKVLIADPAAEGKGGGASWNAVPRTYWISLTDLGTWIGGKGYTG